MQIRFIYTLDSSGNNLRSCLSIHQKNKKSIKRSNTKALKNTKTLHSNTLNINELNVTYLSKLLVVPEIILVSIHIYKCKGEGES